MLWLFYFVSFTNANHFLHVLNLQEAAVVPPYVAFAIRPSPGFWEYVKVSANDLSVEGITATEYLKYKEMTVDETWYVNQIHLCFFLFSVPFFISVLNYLLGNNE